MPAKTDARWAARAARIAAEFSCATWLVVGDPDGAVLAQQGMVQSVLLRFAAPRKAEAPRALRRRRMSAGPYRDLVAVRLREPRGGGAAILALARLQHEPMFDDAELARLRGRVAEVSQAPAAASEDVLSSIRHRSPIDVVLLDRGGALVCASAEARTMLRELGWDGNSSRLPEALANAVASATAGWPEDLAGASEQYSAAIPAMVLRIVPLTGPDGGRIGVFLERSRRDRLERTALQYQVSARELEVMRLLLRGLASEEIARELGISENTVITYMRNVIAKTGSKNRSEAIGKLLAS